jgi:hypothetical protein
LSVECLLLRSHTSTSTEQHTSDVST